MWWNKTKLNNKRSRKRFWILTGKIEVSDLKYACDAQTKIHKQYTTEVVYLNYKCDAITPMAIKINKKEYGVEHMWNSLILLHSYYSNVRTCWWQENTKPLKTGYTDRRNTELSACVIFASSDVPAYNMQHPIQMDNYIILVAK